MQMKLIDNGFRQHGKMLCEVLKERIKLDSTGDEMRLELNVDATLGKVESYEITREENTWKISGSDEMGLYYGIGKFLHTATWTDEKFIPKTTAGVQTPDCSYRAIYFSVHFYNWYQMALIEDLKKYLRDMLLWGYNVVMLIIPLVNISSTEDGIFRTSVERTRVIFQLAKEYGMKLCLGITPNQGVLSTPDELLAGKLEGFPNAGKLVCPSNPNGMAHLKEIWCKMLEQYTDIGLDYIQLWPYDEGGCSCEECHPWGANGYCKASIGVYEEARKYYPNAKYVVGTWLFDQPESRGEYQTLYERLTGDMSWVDYLIVDAYGDYPKYPLEHEPVKPVVNFPEMSMWGLYPWGGFGANPLPQRFQRLWDSSKYILDGGMPYSEGIYEDITKIQFIGYYWNRNRNWKDILAEYINYEYDAEVCSQVVEMMECIEENHTEVQAERRPNLETAVRAERLAREADAILSDRAKNSWRWRILYIRALLDRKRYEYFETHHMGTADDFCALQNFSGDFLTEDEEAQAYFKELRELYCCVPLNGENQYTLPPLNGGTLWRKKTYDPIQNQIILVEG